ncbi:hypothetical protein BDV93DRAFT_526305 [Ceratobasidium sp. AG-I]|nr:hypothetical protein BDV93DRAFT_526305 [Ceratobasidium sp. AG-I]
MLRHVNIAQLVGATEGSRGLNGIIVVMDGIDINDFWRQTHSGAAWAKSISDIYAFRTSFPKLVLVRRITVAPDGHITVFPFGSIASQSEGISDKVVSTQLRGALHDSASF